MLSCDARDSGTCVAQQPLSDTAARLPRDQPGVLRCCAPEHDRRAKVTSAAHMPEWDAVAATVWQRQLEYGIQLQRQLPMRDSSPFERAAAVLCSSAGYRINSAVLSEDNLATLETR